MKAKDTEIEAAQRAMKTKEEELDSVREQCKQLKKDIENAGPAAQWELWQERQTFENEMRKAKVMLFFPFSANTV